MRTLLNRSSEIAAPIILATNSIIWILKLLFLVNKSTNVAKTIDNISRSSKSLIFDKHS